MAFKDFMRKNRTNQLIGLISSKIISLKKEIELKISSLSITMGKKKYTQSGGNVDIPDEAVQKAVTPTAPKNGQIAIYDGTSGQQKGLDMLPLEKGGTGQSQIITLTSSDDINEITTPGMYILFANNAPHNYPYPNKFTAILKVEGNFTSADSQKIQRLTMYGSQGKNIERTLVNDTFGWTPWSKALVTDDIDWGANVDKLLYWNGSFVRHSDITNTELDCLSGVRSNIQAQLDGKVGESEIEERLDSLSDTVDTLLISMLEGDD